MLPEIAMFERSVHGSDAENAILEHVAELESKKGYVFHHYKKKTSDVVYVEDESGKEMTYGLGKGVHSKLGAYGECLEHLYYRDIGKRDSTSMSKEEFEGSPLCESDILVQYLMQLDGVPENLECLPFKVIRNDSHFNVPSVMMNYHYLEHQRRKKEFEIFLGRYVTTSGTAFALTEDDAYLHALNETLERDITSEFFLKISGVQYEFKNEFMHLSIESMPKYLLDLLNDIRERYCVSAIDIYLCQSIYGTWWSFCVVRFPDSSERLLPEWGAGNSLLYDLAIYRSISEVVQMLDNYESENQTIQERLIRFVKAFPKFRPVAYLDNMSLLFPDVEYNSDENISPMPVKQQIETITSQMEKEGFLASIYPAYRSKGCNVVCSFTPNLERFYNITKSTVVLPLGHIKKHLSE